MQKSNLQPNAVQSRMQVLTKCRQLKNFDLIGYIEQLQSDVHVIRLQFMRSVGDGSHRERITADFRVTEGYAGMFAVSLDGKYSFTKLT